MLSRMQGFVGAFRYKVSGAFTSANATHSMGARTMQRLGHRAEPWARSPSSIRLCTRHLRSSRHIIR